MVGSADPEAVARRLYTALNAHDPAGIMSLLRSDFLGVASEGMPVGGGRHEGAAAMLRDCWGPVFQRFDVAVEPGEFLVVADDRVVVTGRYLGSERGTDRRVDARFAHVLRLDGDAISELVQYTDTARWGTS